MYIEATKLDQYLAIAYFQEGVSNFLLAEFDEALGNFNDALLVWYPMVVLMIVFEGQHLHRLRTTGSQVQIILLRSPLQSGFELYVHGRRRARNAGFEVRNEGETDGGTYCHRRSYS